MNTFTIAELQQFSGIKAHTIRIWEQRYQALTPDRTEGNARLYDSSQLKRLLNIVSLMNADYKVAALCTMPDESLHELLRERLSQAKVESATAEIFISQLIAAALTYDEPAFHRLYTEGLKKYKLKQLYTEILYPTLVRLGLMWANDTLRPAHEHFITNLIRQKILAATDALPIPKGVEHNWLLFLPENEFHETGLLMAGFLLRQSGQKVIYLGADVPFDTLIAAADHVKISHLLCFLVRRVDLEADIEYINSLQQSFKGKKIRIACDARRLENITLPKAIRLIHSIPDLEHYIIEQ